MPGGSSKVFKKLGPSQREEWQISVSFAYCCSSQSAIKCGHVTEGKCQFPGSCKRMLGHEIACLLHAGQSWSQWPGRTDCIALCCHHQCGLLQCWDDPSLREWAGWCTWYLFSWLPPCAARWCQPCWLQWKDSSPSCLSDRLGGMHPSTDKLPSVRAPLPHWALQPILHHSLSLRVFTLKPILSELVWAFKQNHSHSH